jgi:phage terminase small subunit
VVANNLSKGASRVSGRPLTNGKHEHFAHRVAKGESPAKAYVGCGYSESWALQSGNRLLRKPDIAERVEELKTAVSERLVEKFAVDRVSVLRMLTENARRAMQIEPVRDREGNPIGQYVYQGSVANKALDLLGKEIEIFQQKPEKQGLDIHEMMARLHKGRERNAQAKRDRDAAAAGSPNLISRGSEHSQIVEAEKKIATHGLGRDVPAPDDLIDSASQFREMDVELAPDSIRRRADCAIICPIIYSVL